jgi:hypothetical protein
MRPGEGLLGLPERPGGPPVPGVPTHGGGDISRLVGKAPLGDTSGHTSTSRVHVAGRGGVLVDPAHGLFRERALGIRHGGVDHPLHEGVIGVAARILDMLLGPILVVEVLEAALTLREGSSTLGALVGTQGRSHTVGGVSPAPSKRALLNWPRSSAQRPCQRTRPV